MPRDMTRRAFWGFYVGVIIPAEDKAIAVGSTWSLCAIVGWSPGRQEDGNVHAKSGQVLVEPGLEAAPPRGSLVYVLLLL